MKMKKILALVLAVAIMCTALAACGTTPESSSSDVSTSNTDASGEDTSGADTPEPVATGMYPGTPDPDTIVLNIATEPATLNTTLMTDTVSFTVARHLTQGLTILDETDNVLPGVAESWTLSDDGLVYNFKLRSNAKWTNGDAVTANDFVFAWTTLMDPETASQYAYFAHLVKNGAAFTAGEAKAEDLGLKAISDTELEVTLEKPVAYALNLFAFGVMSPINESFYNEVGAENYNSSPETACTNGPYILTNWVHESTIELVKNEDYWNVAADGAPKITMVMIGDSNAILNAFKAGEIDMGLLTGDQAAMMREEGYPVQQYADGASFYLNYNTLQPGLNNAKVRKALGLAIDKQAFIDSILKNSSMPSTGFVSSAVTGLDTYFQDEMKAKFGELLSPNPNVEEAKKLLEEGLAEENLTVETFAISIISDDSDQAVLNATFIQEQINSNLGLDMKIESMPFASRLERQRNKDFMIIFGGWGPDYNDPNTFLNLFVTDGGNNSGSYSNPEYDKLVADAAAELDPAKRMEMFYEVEKIICEEVPVYPIYWRIRDYVVSEKIDGGYRTMLQDINFSGAKIK